MKFVLGSPPSPEEIKAARKHLGLTQTNAAGMVYAALRTWQQWEAGDRVMRSGDWELFLIKGKLISATNAILPS